MSGILVLIAILLVVAVVFLVARTTELLGTLKGEGQTTDESNLSHGIILMIFMVVGLIGGVWSLIHYKHTFLPPPASEHGKTVDQLFMWTTIAIGIVFFITQILLFYFAYRYRSRKGRTAMFFSHDNKLEIIWTVIPAIVLAILVVYGLESWLKIFAPTPKDAQVVEVTAEQFQWEIRYPGKDGQLGPREFKRISGTNSLGIVWSDSTSHDDVMPTEIHLVVNKPVLFKLGSKDVIHGFFLPQFRLQMNCVPGIPTQFWMTPTITTDSMREITGNPKFEYELACAQLCGASHYNMRRVVVVESQEKYNQWLATLQPVYDPTTMGKEETPVKTAEAKEESKEENK